MLRELPWDVTGHQAARDAAGAPGHCWGTRLPRVLPEPGGAAGALGCYWSTRLPRGALALLSEAPAKLPKTPHERVKTRRAALTPSRAAFGNFNLGKGLLAEFPAGAASFLFPHRNAEWM